ncbi:MAG: hypothetical protein A2Y73_00940 [Chloroflexi bacterium RBG_13_56_8]|nr:MAG: hypothetical protein A2Y73_00940 [Chloroflexi bacterium RBG_13_56_8]
MPIVYSVRFRGNCKAYHFSAGDMKDLQIADQVIVETSRGEEIGQVVTPAKEINDEEIVGQLKPILRKASPADLVSAERFHQKEAEAVEICQKEAAKFNLPMKIIGTEYSYDGTRLTFFFTAEERVDFRELVRELARIFKTHIELRQIGVRDEARMVGGLGKCGRMLCCATWLTDFSPVSIRMAKQQNLPLSPTEISGLCGRLLCCLGYEDDYYKEVKSRFPRVGKMIDSPYGQCKVVKVNVLRETVMILREDGSTVELSAEELAHGTAPIPKSQPGRLSETQRQALDAIVGTPSPSPQELPEATPQQKNGEESPQRTRRRPRSRRQPRSSSPARATTEPKQPQGNGESKGDSQATQPSRRPRRRRRGRGSSPQQGENSQKQND